MLKRIADAFVLNAKALIAIDFLKLREWILIGIIASRPQGQGRGRRVEPRARGARVE